jgi:hypothetical protein
LLKHAARRVEEMPAIRINPLFGEGLDYEGAHVDVL